MDRTEILIVTYAGWESYIRNFNQKGDQDGLILLGAHAERDWRYLIDTEKYFSYVIYVGVASIPDLKETEVFGQIRYQYTLRQAYKDHLMVQVTIDYLDAPLISGNDFSGDFILAEKIWEDMLLHEEKRLKIAETISQAQFLQQSLLQFCVKTSTPSG